MSREVADNGVVDLPKMECMGGVDRELFADRALEVAPRLLGARLSIDSADGPVSLLITEVEAYHGVGTPGPYDAGSHSRSRQTERNASMFGPPGHAYVYLSHGLHFALNFVCSPEGAASGVLIRAGEIVAGEELARIRRRQPSQGTEVNGSPSRNLARGPGNLARALGVTRLAHDGRDLLAAPFDLRLAEDPPAAISTGPRVGVSGEAGSIAFPWRFWVTGDRTVSAYRPGKNVPREL